MYFLPHSTVKITRRTENARRINKEISDKKAAKILGISPARTVVPPDKAPDVVLSDGTRKKGEMIVTYQADFVTEVSCTAIEEGWVKPIPIWTWGK